MFLLLTEFFEKNKAAITGLCFLLFLVLLASRRIDAFSNPQFWAEDGRNWFAAAYNNGIKSLLWTQEGYFQTFSRLVGYVVSKFFFEHAPLLFNLTALGVELLVAMFILSDRLKKVIPFFAVRFFIALYFVLLPNSAEAHLNLTNSQWYLAMLTILIMFSVPAINLRQKLFDVSALVLSGLSGPFSILIAPFALFEGYKAKNKWVWLRAGVISVCGLIQVLGLLVFSNRDRIEVYLGANPGAVLKIFDRQVILSALIGENGTTWLLGYFENPTALYFVISALALLISFWALLKASRQLKMFTIFSIVIFSAALYTPTIGDFTKSGWQVLYDVTDGPRYWMMPMMAFFLIILWNLRPDNKRVFKVVAALFLVFVPVGVFVDFIDKPFIDYNFRVEANNFKGTPSGAVYQLPINPEGWVMQLKKK